MKERHPPSTTTSNYLPAEGFTHWVKLRDANKIQDVIKALMLRVYLCLIIIP
jgi:hypothetical protein